MPNTHPNRDIDLQQISARNDHARYIVAGCAADAPTLAEMWRALDAALADTAALCAQVTLLSAKLDRALLDRADLLAAMRATLAAHADGEADPLWYLRDELNASERPAAASRRAA